MSISMEIATCARIAPRSPFAVRRFMVLLIINSLIALRLLGGGQRRVHSACPFHRGAYIAVKKPSGERRKRWHFIGIERTNEPRRNHDHQFRPFLSLSLALEQMADDGELAENRNERAIVLRH